MNDYESIKSKLKKLLALAEGGVGGEARNARKLLERLCEQHGVSIDELLDTEKKQWYDFKVGGRKIDKNIFFQCFFKVTNAREVNYRQSPYAKASLSVELTAYQYAEIKSMFDWHKANFQKEVDNMLDTLFHAYCSKLSLYSDNPNDDEDYHLTPDDLRRIIAIRAMRETLNDNSYFKQIENK